MVPSAPLEGGAALGKLDGKVVFITGAARGQGRSHAVLLAEEGADVIGVDICAPIDTLGYPLGTREDLDETVRLVEQTGRSMLGLTADVRHRGELQAALDAGLARFGRLDIVLANAGIAAFQLIPYERSEQAWQDSLDVMLTGVWNTLQVTAPVLIEQDQGGSIVITASTAGARTVTTNFDGGYDGYQVSKLGNVALMKAYAGRLGRHNIRVNTVHPTTCDTPLGRGEPFENQLYVQASEIMATFNHVLPIGNIDPIDISRCILYLVSEDGRYVTGQQLYVDAGNTTVAAVGSPGIGAGGMKARVVVEP
jgi:SDR family mycofactocin-dependent oxidoreductase